MARFAAGLCSLVISVASFATVGCGNAQEAPRSSNLPVFKDVGEAAPLELTGVLWIGGGTVVGVLDPVRNSDEALIVEAVVSMGSVRASRNGEPIVAFTNTIEVDCAGERYRKLADTYLSADGRPLSRGVYETPPWHDGLYPVLKRACGDMTVTPNGPAFSGMTEFLGLFDAEARRLGVETRVSGPTISRAD